MIDKLMFFVGFLKLTLAVCMCLLKMVTVTILMDRCFDVPSGKRGSGHLVKGEI
jgi:hypothetical protein